MPGPTIGTLPYNPDPPGDARHWVQGPDGRNMGTSVDDLTNRAVGAALAAMPGTDPAVVSAMQTISATVSSGSDPSMLVRFAANQAVTVGNLLNPHPVSGSVEVHNTAQAPVHVNVTNPQAFPTSMAVSGTVATLGPGALAASQGKMYGITAGPQALLTAAAPLAMLVNPANSRVTVYLDSFALSGGADCYLTRGRLATAPTSNLGTPVPVAVNSLGAASTPAAKLYLNPGTAAAGAVVEWSTHAKGGAPLSVALDGRVALAPGQAAVWSAQALGLLSGTGLLVQAAVTPSWWEVPLGG